MGGFWYLEEVTMSIYPDPENPSQKTFGGIITHSELLEEIIVFAIRYFDLCQMISVADCDSKKHEKRS